MKKGIVIGILWAFVSWIPFYTGYLLNIKGILSLPAILGINLELATGVGDAFIYSIIIGTIIGGLCGSLLQHYTGRIKVIRSRKKKKTLGRS
ncbi:hypothetical protein H0A61_01945 [Koleobacter methoxysyntrophicus]|jgi:uncharacterized protein (DUF2062 family)|uniref:Uncharacterized protein n=1 Tax=Koleobacter methoxysyntrophicus TaxID=2751313 RepID=A0A8A0RNV3_9FIRM|nr:hypothetical protein [Koleobacter methoxysyntrophicus]QSQ09572.1 hypothetical protein H0A61_01945 [Koleobacter methoxysyntrophicus]